MQTNEMNLENRVKNSKLERLGTGLRHAIYAARKYIAMSAAAIIVSIGATGCTDDDVEECNVEYQTPDNDLCNFYTEFSNPKDGINFIREGDRCDEDSYCKCTKPKGAPDYECFCECSVYHSSCSCGYGYSCVESNGGTHCEENVHPL